MQTTIKTQRLANQRRRSFLTPLWFESLEDRRLLALDDVISVGRFQSAYSALDVQNHELTITYTVFNQQDKEVGDAQLSTTLRPGVAFKNASQAPSQSGQSLSWSLGTLAPYGSATIELIVTLPTILPTSIDSGAEASGTVNANLVSDEAPEAALRTTAIDAALLASTPDANTSDSFIRATAAKLDHDPQQIFDYLRTEIGYESYEGSLRGARGTLWSNAGNSLDEASLGVALMRASGIPARYAQGTLSTATAQQLILSMFPDPYRVVGIIDPGVEIADPANDAKLLAETRAHHWFEFDAGAGMTPADASFENATFGVALTTPTSRFSEVPDSLRHKVKVSLDREILNTAGNLFGMGSTLDRKTVLEHEFNTVDLVGKPITAGHFVSSNSFGFIFTSTTNTYSPYLAVGEIGGDPIHEEIIRGTDYQEILTNFPFGTTLLTGVFLTIETESPNGNVETFERTIADRIGLDVRRNGGGGGLTLDHDAPPLLGPLDLTTISITPGRHSQAALNAADQQLDALQADYEDYLNRYAATPEGSERDALIPEGIAISHNVFVAAARARLTLFENISDLSTDNLASQMLIKAYWDAPRITIFTSHPVTENGDVTAMRFGLDLRSDDIRAEPYPIQAAAADIGFRITRGMMENGIESGIMDVPPELATDQFVVAPSTAKILEVAVNQGIAIVILSQSNRTQLDALEISREAKIRIVDALDAGKQVIVPASSVMIGGTPRIGWYEQDLQSGATIGVLEDGTHGAMVEYFGLQVDVAKRSATDQFFFGVLAGLGANSIAKAAVFLFGVGVNAAQNDTQQAFTNAKQAVKLFIDFIKQETVKSLIGKPPLFVAGFTIGFSANIVFAADPPVGTSLFGSNPTPELQNLTGADLAVEIIPDPLFSVPFNGALLPTVYRAGIRNLTGVTQTFSLDLGTTPPGFVARTSLTEVTIPAGETAEISIALYPDGTLPPPGEQSSFELLVQSITNPAITATESELFVVPEVRAVLISTDPEEVTTAPGVGVQTVLVLQSVGNVPATVNLQAVIPSNLTLSGLSNVVVIQPGQVLVQFLTLTPAANVSLNSTLAASIRANFGGIEPQEYDIVVHVAAPGVQSLGQASLAARNLGDISLANRLDDLGAALTNLVQNAASPIFKSQATAALHAVIGLLEVDPVLSHFAPPLASARDVLIAAVTSPQIQAAILALADILEDFGEASARLTEGNFAVFLNPSSQVAQPGSPAQFQIILQNIGIATTTYDLSLGALPPGVTGSFSAAAVTLSPGQFSTGLFVTITPPANELFPFDFEVSVSLDGAPDLAKTVHGALTVRKEFLSVVDVTADPLYVNPGESAAISTRLFNAVNQSQSVLVSYVVKNAAGTQVFASSETLAQLNTQTALLNVDLDSFDTTGLANGQYDVEVTVTKADGAPIPGGTGRGTLFIGAPLTATIVVSPTEAPQGTSTVATTLTIESQIPHDNPLSVVSQVAFSGAADVNRYGDFVYVATSSGIRVYNVAGANINAPVFVRTVSGAASFMETKNDRLYVVNSTNTTRLSIYSLADPSNPSLLGATASIPYNNADNMVITDTHVYVSAIQFVFFVNNHDIFDHNGALLSIDISNPAAPFLDGVLFNENGTNNDGIKNTNGVDQFGGNRNVWTVRQATPTLLYLVGSTATGTNTQAGVGFLAVIDISNPLNMTVVREVTIPGTVQALGLSIDGNQAFVTGSSGGWNDFGADMGLVGNVVLTTLDISTPDNPVVTHTETLSRSSRGVSADNTTLGAGVYAFSSLGAAADQPALFVTDVSDPDAPIVFSINAPTEIRRHFSLGAFIYTASPSGLIIYEVDPIDAIRGSASVQIPKNNGVTPIPGSFSTPPTHIIPGSDFDTYVWDVALAAGVSSKVITWNSTITNLASGEIRDNTLDTHVSYTLSAGGPLDLRGLVDTPGAGTSVALYGNIAYVSGTLGISILDITDPDNPQLLSSFTPGNLATGFAFNTLAVSGDQLIVASIFNFNNFQYSLSVYSLADPLNPAQIDNGNARFPFQLSELFVRGTTAYTTASVFLTIGGDSDIFEQGGDFAAIGFANPNAYGPFDRLFAPRIAGAGGFNYINGGDLVTDQIAYLASTTAQGGDTQTGIGRLLVVNVADASDINQTTSLDIPGTVMLHDVAAQGNLALIVGGTGGQQDPSLNDNFGFTGNVTLTVVDISDPQNPQIVGQTLVTPGVFPRGIGPHSLATDITIVGLGGGLFAISGTMLDGKPVILIVDASDPNNLRVGSVETPAVVGGLSVRDGKLYAASEAGLAIYDINPSGLPLSLTLPPTEVVGKQILSLSPSLQTIQPGDTAFYLLAISNPSSIGQTFDLTVEGVPSDWIELLSPIFVSPSGTSFASLAIHSDPFAPQASYSFIVTATSGGIRGSVQGDLFLLGDPFIQDADPHSHGVVAQLIPESASTGIGGAARYKLRVTNTGSLKEAFSITVSGLPAGFNGLIELPAVEIPPGAENYRDLTLVIETPLGAAPSSYPFTVVVQATGSAQVKSQVSGAIQLLNLGVDANFSAATGAPNQTYQLLVKNTGLIAETFDLTLSGPAALVSSLAAASVTLAPGASQVVNVTVGAVDFNYPGLVQLYATAKARSNGAVFDMDLLEIEIAGNKGLAGAFSVDSLPAQQNPFSPLFFVENLGNLEDAYVAEIVSMTGIVSAVFIGLDGNPTATIPLFRLPGLTGAALPLLAQPGATGAGSITVRIRSLTDDSIIAADTLEIGATGNRPPVITSGGGGDVANVSMPENTTLAYDVNSSDPDVPVQPRTYSLGGGADAALFSIDVNSGFLTFKTAPNFEAPADQNQDNLYEVIVRVTDGFLFDTQLVRVTVTNVNEAPVITSGGGGDSASVNVPENATFAYDADAFDPDFPAQTRTYSISGGADAAFFSIDANTGLLSFKTAPDFENPRDQGKNNIYDVMIRVTDGSLFDTQAVAVRVVNINEAPVINSYGGLDNVSLSVPEGSTIAADANSADPDLPAQPRTYSISGGADASRFTVDPGSGILRFITPPDFENPTDVGANNVYNVVVRVTDGELFDTQVYAITVTNVVNETVAFLAVGADAGAMSEPLVKVYRPDGTLLEEFLAYEAGYRGGVRVATGDVTGDGIIDIITAPGRGHKPTIKVFDGASIADGQLGNARELPSFVIDAFDTSFTDGLFIAVGDVVGDSRLDIVAIPERGRTEVRVFRNRLDDTPHPHPGDAFSNPPWRSFLPFDANYVGGGTVAIGEIDRTLAKSEIIVGSSSGMNAAIKVYNVNAAQPKLVKTYTPIDANFRGGVFVAAGDINGDGIADIVAGAGQGGSSKVSVLDGKTGNSLGAIYPYSDASKQASVRVAVRDSNGDGVIDTIFAGHGADGKTKAIRRYDLTSKKMSDHLFETDPEIGGGYFLG